MVLKKLFILAFFALILYSCGGDASNTSSNDNQSTKHFYFLGNEPDTGIELWKSDGSTSGTNRVVELSPSTTLGWYSGLTPFQDKLFFFHGDTTSPFDSLWISDGTEQGTIQLVVPEEGSNVDHSSDSMRPAILNDKLYFSSGFLSLESEELWQSDGTVSGTSLFKNLVSDSGTPGLVGNASYPFVFFSDGNQLFFTILEEAQDSNLKGELFSSDGTPDGTGLLKDILVGPEGSYPDFYTKLGDKTYFLAKDDLSAPAFTTLFETNGTSLGTIRVKNFANPAENIRKTWDMIAAGGNIFLLMQNDTIVRNELWKSDGTISGTELVKTLEKDNVYVEPYSNLIALNNKVYFFARLANGFNQGIWVSDGTDSGTIQFHDIYPGEVTSIDPDTLYTFDNELYFEVLTATRGWQIWKTDGTADGTVIVTEFSNSKYNIDPSSQIKIKEFYTFNNNLYFTLGSQLSLWKSDGTEAGTILVKDFFNTP